MSGAWDLGGLQRENERLRARVAELERAAASDRDAARFLQSLLEVVPGFVARIDSDLCIQYMNTYQPGFTAERVVGRSILEFIDPADRERAGAELERARTTGEVGSWDTLGLGAHGQLASYHTRAAAIRGSDGRTGLCVASVENTVLREREAELRDTEAQLHVARQAFGLGLWSWDALGGLLLWDETMAQLHGRGAPRTLAEYIERVVHPEDRLRVARLFRNVLEGERCDAISFRITRPDGQERWIVSSGALVSDEHGTVLKLLGATLDITEHRVLEEQLQKAQKMESIGSLTAGIVHNFNNMLTVIRPALDLVGPFVPAEHQALSRDASHASQRASELVRQLMAFARHSGKDGRAAHDLLEIVDLAVGICRRAFDQRLLVYTIYEGPPAHVFCNPGQIEQVLINLLLNARDAIEEAGAGRGRVTVRVRSEGRTLPAPAGGEPLPCAQIEITDNGAGLRGDARQRAFEPFFTTKPPGRGTGLGLTTSLAIVRDHDGTLVHRSEPGGGTTFVLALPLCAEAGVAQVVPLWAPVAAPSRVPTHASILLVDNEAAVRGAIGQVLVDSGMRVWTADSGARACLQLMQRPDIDLVLLDRSMPDGPGEHFVPRMRELAPSVRIVFFSGEVLDPEVVALADGVVQKPVDGPQLVQAIATVLGRRHA